MELQIVPLLIIVISGLAWLSLFIFCKVTHVHVAEIEEYYAKQHQHEMMYCLFKASMFIVIISFMFNIRFIVFDVLGTFAERLRGRISGTKK
jgi:hypothetical protein